jgi:hypothetical protein
LRQRPQATSPASRAGPTGSHYLNADTTAYVDALDLAPGARAKVYELNARRAYPRFDKALKRLYDH